ncbi:ABC transporter permease [Compostimonas suwonensis]|uniref:ABC-2 type transport system permease protein n=1 Tax=Compostimonas suwonensis TaxID=1048394 RepID=A0A2M9BYY5_9MICO|nr:ABC transporter permease [Compostimonas suwonensis]PJJ63293.1 ABC-2 type transport system permease protein [Compostimonas suwonensis]
MNATLVFARKETLEIVRTWRIWVLPAIILFFAISSPLLARYTPEILGAVGGDQFEAIALPPASYVDAYAQWIKNLSQIFLFALIIIYGGIVSSETSSGTAILVLTKPMSRGAFVAVKAVVHTVFLAVLVIIGALVTWGLTAAVFGQAPLEPLWSSTLNWLVLGIFYIAMMTFLSVLIPSAAGAAGAGVGVFVLLTIGALWKPLGDHSPAGLAGQAAALAAEEPVPELLWPLLVSITAAVVLVIAAALLFRRKELTG